MLKLDRENIITKMNVPDILKQYLTPKNLQLHMLRVASLAKIITDNWFGVQLDKDAVVRACIFHDIAKPINMDLTKQAQFGMSVAEIADLEKLQQQLKANYDNEHRAVVGIYKTIGSSPKVIEIIDNLEWINIPSLLQKNDFDSFIPIYCDMRIGPKGIMELQQRLKEVEGRTGEGGYEQTSLQLEKILSQNVSVDLNKITDEQINKNFSQLEDLVF